MMSSVHSCVADIVLHPGDWHVSEGNTRIRTLLGTCVSIVLWHPQLRIGGMCHYMLPGRSPNLSGALDGRYAEDAFQLMQTEVFKRGTHLSEYCFKLVGGGSMFPDANRHAAPHVGIRNADAARQLMRTHGLHCAAEHLEGIGHREVVFDTHEGRVQVKQTLPVRIHAVTVNGGVPCIA